MGLTDRQIKNRDKRLQNLSITTYEEKKGYVFVSYKSDDWKVVFEKKIFELQEHGLRIYSDKDFDNTNSCWLEDMEINIKHASAFLMFISPEYLKSSATSSFVMRIQPLLKLFVILPSSQVPWIP